MHSVVGNPVPPFLDRGGNRLNDFEKKYQDLHQNFTWNLETSDHVKLMEALVEQFGPQVKLPPVRGDRDYSSVGICAYCERDCDVSGGEARNEIDHFLPRERFNVLTFEWQNLMYSCHRCNDKKGDKAPNEGYVNPREPDAQMMFDYDLNDGAIGVNIDLPHHLQAKARKTIEDLDLHATHLNAMRIGQYKIFVEEFVKADPKNKPRILNRFQSPGAPFSSFIKAKVKAEYAQQTRRNDP